MSDAFLITGPARPPTILAIQSKRELNEMEYQALQIASRYDRDVRLKGRRDKDIEGFLKRDALSMMVKGVVMQPSGYEIPNPMLLLLSNWCAQSFPQVLMWAWSIHMEIKLPREDMTIENLMKILVHDGHIPTEEGYLWLWQHQKTAIIHPTYGQDKLMNPNVWSPQGSVEVIPDLAAN